MSTTRPATVPAKRGGKRAGAGRPRVHAIAQMRHEARPAFEGRASVYVSMRVIEAVGDLRGREQGGVVRQAIEGAQRSGFQIVHVALQRDQLHLVAEADDARSMWRGVRSLQVAMARGLNKVSGRSGRVFVDRYQQEIIGTPSRLRAVLADHFGERSTRAR